MATIVTIATVLSSWITAAAALFVAISTPNQIMSPMSAASQPSNRGTGRPATTIPPW
jgi:hypothetical protein